MLTTGIFETDKADTEQAGTVTVATAEDQSLMA